MTKAQAAKVPQPANDAVEEESQPWSTVAVDVRKQQLGKLFVSRAIEDRIVNVINHARSDRLIYPEPRTS